MDEKLIDKAIGYGIATILFYYFLGIFIPILIWGVVGLIAFRIYLEYRKYQ